MRMANGEMAKSLKIQLHPDHVALVHAVAASQKRDGSKKCPLLILLVVQWLVVKAT